MKRIFATLFLIATLLLCIAFPTKVNASDKLALDEQTITLEIDTTHKLKLGKIKATDITWWSGDKSIATVSKWGTVTAKRDGTVKITAKYNNKKYACFVTVVTPIPYDATAEPGSRLNPINAFEGATFSKTDVMGEAYEVSLKLIDVTGGEKANKIMAEEDVFNSIPRRDQRWVIYHFTLEFIKGSDTLKASSLINLSSFHRPDTRFTIPYCESTFSKNLKGFDPDSVVLKEGEKADIYIAMILDKSQAYTTIRVFQGYDKDMNPMVKWFTTKID